MRGFWKRALIWLCAAALLFPAGALAEFSPRWEALNEGDGVTVSLSGSLDSLSGVSKQSLGIMNAWLSRLEAAVSLGRDSRAEILLDGDALLSASVQRQSAYHLTVFGPSGSAYLTDPAGKDALALLAGSAGTLPDVTVLPELYAAIAAPLYAALEQGTTPKTVKEATSIKNAASSASYVNYLFKNGELNDVWPEALSSILPVMKEVLDGQPGVYAQLKETLSALTFSGECRFKRFLDKEGNDLGLQFTGQAAKGDDKRKVTLFGGFTPDKGGYISLSLPAVSGKNTLKASLGVKLTSKKGVNTLDADGSYTRTFDGVTTAYTMDGSLKNAVKDEEEAWTGKITWTATENKVKTTWTLTPSLTFDGAGLYGKVTFQQKEGNTVKLKGTLNLSLRPLEEITVPAAFTAKDLRLLTEEQARTAVLEELVPLIGALAELFAALPEAERTLLLHELRTDAWMNGPAVSEEKAPVPIQPAVIETTPVSSVETDGDWVVEENEQ